MPLPPAILRAQRVSLFGYGYAAPNSDQYEYSNYAGQGLGATLSAYDLNTPGVVTEIKNALIALAKQGADPFANRPPNQIVETTWQKLSPDDNWDAATGQEFLLAMARYGQANSPSIPGPYVQQGLPGGSPQPSVAGLETLAGAARAHIGPSMPLYEAWRSGGCTICLSPPSNVSMPPATTPVTPTFQAGNRLVPPANADPAALSILAAYDSALQVAWNLALLPGSEAQMANVAKLMQQSQANRDAAAQLAIDSVPGRQGVTVLDTAMNACLSQGGNWDPVKQACATGAGPLPPPSPASMMPVVVVGALAAGAYWLFGRKGKR